MHLFVFKCRLSKNGFSVSKRFRGFWKTGLFPISTGATHLVVSPISRPDIQIKLLIDWLFESGRLTVR